jgi:GNAT superfamily N-acetyltransferase
MAVRVVEEAKITQAEDEAIRDGLCMCFPPDRPVFSLTRKWHGTGPAWSVIVEEGPVIAAHVGVVDRIVTAGPDTVRVAGIQNLFVLPDFRGRGLGRAVMERAMEEAGRRGFECGLLFCVPDLERLYVLCHWQLLPRERVLRIDEHGREADLPSKNIAMYFPLARSSFPPGTIHLQGNDW